MRFLVVTYCFAAEGREVLIGVYKRGLRIALELESRGHEVYFDCTGRHGYSDAMTALAEERLRFVDLGLGQGGGGPDAIRESSVRAIADIAPDVVVVGEAPLAGTLLESTLCAVELEIPVVVLDNAYFPTAVSNFLAAHAGMIDGFVLTGPTCTHTPNPPPHVEQVPPFVTSIVADAERVVSELGLRRDRLVVVLAYDRMVEHLAFSLVDRLGDVDFLFLSKQPETCAERAAELPHAQRERVRVLGLPPEPVLFGLIELARLAIAKGGFMQVTECLALRTPAIVAYWEGTAWLRHVAPACREFTHLTPSDEADDETVAAALRFLALDEDAMASVHDGTFAAAARTADFLERIPSAGRPARRGSLDLTERDLSKAVRALGAGDGVRVREVRSMCIRSEGVEEVHAVTCRYTSGDDQLFARLWARRTPTAAGVLVGRGRAARAGRTVVLVSPRRRLLIERDFGHGSIPPTW